MSRIFSKLWLLLCLMGMAGICSVSAQVITNVSVVNVTPSTFGLVWAASGHGVPSISIYSDAAGTSSLAGQVGIEWYPLHTGDPAITNAYYRRQNQAAMQQSTINQGLSQVRVSSCAPNTTYYYRLTTTSTNGQQTVWPASGPLPSVTTAVENDFVLESRQLIITVPGSSPGSIVILSSSNTPSLLAAVVGDGVSSNEVYFNLSDLLAIGGQTNFLPLGDQSFAARLLGTSAQNTPQVFSLNFTGNFLTGGAQQESFSVRPTLSIGSAVLQAGQNGAFSINLNAVGAVTNLSFLLDLPTNRFSQMSLQPLAPQLSVASLQNVDGNSFRVSFAVSAGQALQGGEELAQLNFTAISNQSSAFVPLIPQSMQGAGADGSALNNVRVQAGRVVIIGSQPLLDSLISSNRTRELALYGIPGRSYQIQSATTVTGANGWKNVERVPMTNQVETISGLDTNAASIFYRAYEFTAQPPILDILGSGELVLYGVPWSAYEVDYTTNLAPTSWNLVACVPLTNSFQFITGLNARVPGVYYRAHILNADPPILVPHLANQTRSLLMFGLAGTNYDLQYATNLSNPVTWHPLLSYRLTNAFQSITNLGNDPSIFYRLKKQ